MRNLHSSQSTGRLWRTKNSWNGESSNIIKAKPKGGGGILRVKGSKAPENEMVDHLKRNSVKELHRL